MPRGADIQLFRRLGYGQLAEFHLLDTRQYRSYQATSDENTEARWDPERTLLGDEQEPWLIDGMVGTPRTWNILAQQSKVAETDDTVGPGQSYPRDNWDGYAAARSRLFDAVHEHLDRMAENPHILFYNQRRGYQRCVVTPDELRTDYLVVPYVSTPGAPIVTRATAYVEAGRPGIAELEHGTIV